MNILKELIDSICKSSEQTQRSLGIEPIMGYLFNEIFSSNRVTLYKYYNDGLSIENIKKLITSDEWTLECFTSNDFTIFNREKLSHEINILFSKYFSSENLDLTSKIKKLLLLHFADTSNANLLFDITHQPPCKTYVSWQEKENDLLKLLQKENIVFVTGNPGSGKKELVKYVIKQYCSSKYPDYLFLTQGASLQNKIEQVKFVYSLSNNKDTMSCLKEKDEHSVLVIDMPTIKNEDYQFILDNLRSLRMRIIITTRVHSLPSEFKSINVDNRPAENLNAIYMNSDSNNVLSKSELEQLYQIINNNPYITMLVAKTLHKTPSFKAKFLDNNTWIWQSQNFPKIHASYHDNGNKSSQEILRLIIRLTEDYYTIYKNHKTLSKLSIWARHPINLTLLEKHFGYEEIHNLINLGILQYQNESCTKVYIPAIFADIIWYDNPIKYSDYEKEIASFIEKLKVGQPLTLPFSDLYPILMNLIIRFHFQLSDWYSRAKSDVKSSYDKWNYILIDLMFYMTRLGYWKNAQQILPYLFYYTQKNKQLDYSDTIPETKYLRRLLKIQTDFMDTPNMYRHIENLSSCITDMLNDKNLSQAALKVLPKNYTALLIQNMLDYFIREEKNETLSLITDSSCSDENTLLRILESIEQLLKISAQILPENLHTCYLFMYSFINTIYAKEDIAFTFTIEHLKAFFDNKNLPPELLLKGRVERMYYSYVLFSIKPYLIPQNLDEQSLVHITVEYNSLCNVIFDKIHPWDILWPFYTTTLWLYGYPGCDDTTKENIRKALLDYKYRCEEQISISDTEKVYITTLVNALLNQ